MAAWPLIDQMKTGMEQGWPGDTMYRTALLFLGLMAVAYAVRELLKVAQSYLVENTCTSA